MLEQHLKTLLNENCHRLSELSPSRVANLRQHALHEFSRLGFPHKKLEMWRYTDLSLLGKASWAFKPPAAHPLELNDELHALLSSVEQAVVVLNGQISKEYSKLSHLPDSISCQPILEALKDLDQQLFREKESFTDQEGLLAFNTALFDRGLVLNIPSNTVLDQPLHIIIYSDYPDPCLVNRRHSISLGEHSELTLVMHYLGKDQQRICQNTVSEFNLGVNAHLRLINFQEQGDEVYHLGHTRVKQQKNSVASFSNFSFGAALSREDIQVDLLQPGAECQLNGLYLASEKQHVDYHLLARHLAGHTQSLQNYRGIVADQARSVFNSKVFVQANAQKVVAEQKNDNLLLSSTAEVNSKPELEIYADDVSCGHGATVGQLDEQALFFLRARGIGCRQAKQMLTLGFARAVVETIKDPQLAKRVEKKILAKLMAMIRKNVVEEGGRS